MNLFMYSVKYIFYLFFTNKYKHDMRQKLLELVIRAEKKNRNLKAKINISI